MKKVILLISCLFICGCGCNKVETPLDDVNFNYEEKYGEMAKYYETTDNIATLMHLKLKAYFDYLYEVGEEVDLKKSYDLSFDLPSNDFIYEGTTGTGKVETIANSFVKIDINYENVHCIYNESIGLKTTCFKGE